MRGSSHLLGAYRPGNSPVHRAPLALKAAAVVILSAGVLAFRALPVLGAAFLLVLGAYAAARLLSESWRPLKLMWPILLLLGVFQAWSNGPAAALLVVGNIVVCVAAARLLTLTTALQDLLDGLVALAGPFRFLGADPERFGLTLALMLRSIPFLLGSAQDVRHSAMARGLERNPRALTVPVVIRAVAYAQQTGDALAARGIGESSGSPDVPKRRQAEGRG
ncbi:energy-coupling factor transporter transmembrane protein EcfT [Arthrobacter sp. APC 3897]|uniref:energy-coupling factor transporter transmembrane component T family protein n=1 Tax=Arthrobacter sp. APC 3897 TaxID=3035204 RepID=UPI0025B2DE81|nr:energy-coupling factor transporter transmembrane protein EcfT [Arthrobacter sp. APC 3897]MDN3480447.1 energy-coupling factor transporter transmembrane protein EcfT [Arthrobacter sp. APC 3897]